MPWLICFCIVKACSVLCNVTEHLMFGSALSITCWVSCPLDENLVTLVCVVECVLKRTAYPYSQFGWTSPTSACFPSKFFQSNFQYSVNKTQVERRNSVITTGALALISFCELPCKTSIVTVPPCTIKKSQLKKPGQLDSAAHTPIAQQQWKSMAVNNIPCNPDRKCWGPSPPGIANKQQQRQPLHVPCE